MGTSKRSASKSPWRFERTVSTAFGAIGLPNGAKNDEQNGSGQHRPAVGVVGAFAKL